MRVSQTQGGAPPDGVHCNSMTELARQRHSFADYLDLEAMSRVKHEYLDGQVWAMARCSPDHAAIAMNVGAILVAALRDRPCRVYSSDLRVRVQATGLATYADLSVVCGSLQTDPEDRSGRTDASWTLEVVSGADAQVRLASVDCALMLAEVYRNPLG
jgi:Uma2 family endonuclease